MWRPISLQHDRGEPGHWSRHPWDVVYLDWEDALDVPREDIYVLGQDPLPGDAPPWAHHVLGRIYGGDPDLVVLFRIPEARGWGLLGFDWVNQSPKSS